LRPNLLLDITDIIERKAKAIDVFKSQLARSDYKNQILGLNRFRSYTLGLGVTAAEAYCCVAPADLRYLLKQRCFNRRYFDRNDTVLPQNSLFKNGWHFCENQASLLKNLAEREKWILKKRLRSFKR